MTVPDTIVLVLLCLAAVVFTIAIGGMLVARTVLDRLHFMAAITSAVAPLVAIAAAVHEGVTLSAAMVLATGLIVALSGPVLAMAVARVIEQEHNADTERSPE